MLNIGLKFAETLGNAYIKDLKPSINTQHTTFKISEIFVEKIKPLILNEWDQFWMN